jgi:hypothetical protein
LFGNVNNVDVTEDIDRIYQTLRSHRLKNFEIRWTKVKTDLLDFHSFVLQADFGKSSHQRTWEWRVWMVKEACALLLALAADIPEEFFDRRTDAENCLSTLRQWSSTAKVDLDSLEDPHANLILTTAQEVQDIRLKKSFRDADGKEYNPAHTVKVIFSTVNSAGGRALKEFCRRSPLIIVDEG